MKHLHSGFSLIVIFSILFSLGAAPSQPVGASAGPASRLSTQLDYARQEIPTAPLAPATPDGITFTRTITANRDTHVRSTFPAANYSTSADLYVERSAAAAAAMEPNATYNESLSLIGFDISVLPANAVIDSATLQLYSMINLLQAQSPDTITIVPDAVTSAWTAATVTWNTRPSRANQGETGTVYSTGWHNITVTNIVSAWQTLALANNGIALRLSGTQTGMAIFNSLEAGTTALPRLVVTYHTTGSPALLPVQADTYIDSTPANTGINYASAAYFRVGGGVYSKKALLKFDLASLPADIHANSANLKIYSEINLLQTNALTDISTDLITSTWNENTVTWNSNVQHISRSDPASPYVTGWMSLDVTNIVNDWLSGTYVNNGLLLRTGSTAYDFFAIPAQSIARLEIAYESNPPPCTPVTSVGLSGPTSGLTNTSYAFTASPTRGATAPVSYTWSATGFSSTSGTVSQSYSWATTGNKKVTVTAQNACGNATTNKTIVISSPPPACTVPLTGVSIQGPAEGLLNTGYTFTSTLIPDNATGPVTYSWAADGQVGTFNQSSALFNWPTSGTKNITLTATNCGGTFEALKSVYVVPTAELADLLVSNIWYEPDNARLGYLVHNQGGRSVPAGFSTQFKYGTSQTYIQLFPEDVPAGAVRSAYLNQPWTCADASAVLEATTDFASAVLEQNESNNAWQATWACDLTPPFITGGPNINFITEHTAALTWTTDDATNTKLTYGWSTFNTTTATIASFTTSHAYNFTGLVEGMTYHVDILATNQNGLTVSSTRKYFHTNPAGSDQPVVNSVTLNPVAFDKYEFYRLTAALTDPAGADRVEFFWDGVLLGTDTYPGDGVELIFSPHAQGWTRAQFFTSHSVRAKAFNRQNESGLKDVSITPAFVQTPAALSIFRPDGGAEVFIPGVSAPANTDLPVQYKAVFYEWKCTGSGFSESNPAGLSGVRCDDVDRLPSQVRLELFNAITTKTLTITSPSANVETANLELDGAPKGIYSLRLMAKVAAEGFQEVSQPLSIVQGSPTLDITRQVTRTDNYFDVQLTLVNRTGVALQLTGISDSLVGFQNVARGDLGAGVSLVSTVSPYTDVVLTNLVFSMTKTLSPEIPYSVNYRVVPVLGQTVWNDVEIGATPLKVFLSNMVVEKDVRANSVSDPASAAPLSLMDSFLNAVKTADYILVTNPWRLENNYAAWPEDIQNVYVEMARLARQKNGVLGYLQIYNRDTLDDLLTPGHYWAEALNPVFKLTNQGYVLLVGETEVIPAWYMGSDYFTTFASIPDTVPYSDLPYADTGGNTARPELVIGRILGNSPGQWLLTLQRTTAVYSGAMAWNGMNVLSVSGRGDFVTSDMNPTVNKLDEIFEDANLNSTHMHLYDYSHADRVAALYQFTPEQDVIMLFGHGNPTSWNDSTISPWNAVSIPTGSATPAVFALSCETSNYEDHEDNSVAEGMVNSKSAVYIGATQITELWSGVWALKKFTREWVSHPGASFGVALNMVKDHAFAYDSGAFDHGKHFAYSYNLFGDPKYAPMPNLGLAQAGPQVNISAPRVLSPAGENASAAAWNITLPAYTVEDMDGKDVLDIPGGSWLFVDGSYLVPVITLTQDYPAGTRVRNVTLTARSGLSTANGLNLPQVTSTPFCEGCSGAPLPPAPTGWVPALDQNFSWEVHENADGSSTLALTLTPIHYSGPTKDLLYYQQWSFNVETLSTSLTIRSLAASQRTYPINGLVPVNLWLENTGAAQDVLINTEIRRQISDELVAAQPLRTLNGLLESANLSFTWNSAGIPAGDYSLRVQVLNLQGDTLTEQTTSFTLGQTAAALAAFSHSPAIFKAGVAEQFHLQVQNTGDVPLDGEVVLRVQPVGEDTLVLDVVHPITALAAGGTLTFDDTWTTTGETHQAFTVSAYVRYASQVSQPVVHRIDTGVKMYIPLTRK